MERSEMTPQRLREIAARCVNIPDAQELRAHAEWLERNGEREKAALLEARAGGILELLNANPGLSAVGQAIWVARIDALRSEAAALMVLEAK